MNKGRAKSIKITININMVNILTIYDQPIIAQISHLIIIYKTNKEQIRKRSYQRECSLPLDE